MLVKCIGQYFLFAVLHNIMMKTVLFCILGFYVHFWAIMFFFGRHKQLESILGVAQQFHETLEPLAEWLTATEKCLANSEPIGTQTSKLEEQIAQHKVHT